MNYNYNDLNDDIYYQLFPEEDWRNKEKVDYSISPEERLRNKTVQLYDRNGFAIMEDTCNLDPEEWLNIDISPEEVRERAKEPIRQLLADNGWEINGVMPTKVKEAYYSKFRHNPYWFMSEKDVIDYNIDCNSDLASAYLKYPFVFKEIYSTADDLRDAINYRKNKLFQSEEMQSLDLLGQTEVIRKLAEMSYLHKDQSANRALNYNMKVYARALEKAGMGYIVNDRKYAIEQARETYFDDVLANGSYGAYSRLKELEIMMRTTNKALFSSDDVIREQSENMIAEFLSKPSVNYDDTMRGVTERYLEMGLPVPDRYVNSKDNKEYLLSELEDEDPVITEERKRKAEIEAQRDLEELEEKKQKFLYEKNRPRTLQELIGVDFDYDDPESIENAKETFRNLTSKKEVELKIHDDGRVEMYMPPEEYLTPDQLRNWYPERYEELLEKNKIYPAFSQVEEENEKEKEEFEKYVKGKGILDKDYTDTLKSLKRDSVEFELEKDELNYKYYDGDSKEAIEYRSGVKYNKVLSLLDELNEDNEDDIDYFFEKEKKLHMGIEDYMEEKNRKTHAPKGRFIPGIGEEEIDPEMIEQAYAMTRDGIILEQMKIREKMKKGGTDRDPNATGFAGNPLPMDPFIEDEANREEYEAYEEILYNDDYKNAKYIASMERGTSAEEIYNNMTEDEKRRILNNIKKKSIFDPSRLDEDASEEDLKADDEAFNKFREEHKDDIPPAEEHAQQVIAYLKREYELNKSDDEEPQSVLSQLVAKRRNRF